MVVVAFLSLFSTDSVNPNFVDNWNHDQDSIIVRTKLVNAKTKEVVDDDTEAKCQIVDPYDLTKSSIDTYSYESIPDGEYKYEAYEADFYIDPQTKLRHKYRGESPILVLKTVICWSSICNAIIYNTNSD